MRAFPPGPGHAKKQDNERDDASSSPHVPTMGGEFSLPPR